MTAVASPKSMPANNVVLSRELRSRGVSTRTIAHAQQCCLMPLSHGLFTVTAKCGSDRHTRIREFVTDDAWIDFHATTSAAERKRNPRYQTRLQFLRILHYQHYRPDDVVWASSAAILQQIPLYPHPGRPVEVLNPTARMRSSQIHRSTRRIDDADLTSLHGLVLTHNVRTALDVLSTRGEPAGHAAIEYVLRERVMAELGLSADRALRNYPEHTGEVARSVLAAEFLPRIERLTFGRRRALDIVSIASPLSESYAESRCALNFHMLGLHDVAQQIGFGDREGFIARIDFLHRQSKVIFMVDGVGKYVDGGFATMRKEAAQRNRLLKLGYRVVHLTFADLLNVLVFAEKIFSQIPDLRRYCTSRTGLAGNL